MCMIKYLPAADIEEKAKDIAGKSGINHDFSRIHFMRSKGSKARHIVARCHAMPRILQKALGMKGQYVIEVIGERFDRLDEEERTKTLIHELLHIPKSMGGGFRHHDYACRRNVEKFYKNYVKSVK